MLAITFIFLVTGHQNLCVFGQIIQICKWVDWQDKFKKGKGIVLTVVVASSVGSSSCLRALHHLHSVLRVSLCSIQLRICSRSGSNRQRRVCASALTTGSPDLLGCDGSWANLWVIPPCSQAWGPSQKVSLQQLFQFGLGSQSNWQTRSESDRLNQPVFSFSKCEPINIKNSWHTG